MVTVGHPTDKAQKKLSWLGRTLGCAGAMTYKCWVGFIGAIFGLDKDMHLSSYFASTARTEYPRLRRLSYLTPW